MHTSQTEPRYLSEPQVEKRTTVPIDIAIARLARRQHGVIMTMQLRAAGLSDAALAKRVRAGRLHRVHRGVHAVGHLALSREGTWMAAVLAAGDGAVLCGASAAQLHRLAKRSPRKPRVAVVGSHRRRAGVDVRVTRRLPASDVTVVDGIPVTTVARTLVDLADEVSVHVLVARMREARFRRRLDVPALLECASRLRNRRGHARLLRAVELHLRGRSGTRSLLELRWLALLDAAGVPEPEVGGFVDPGDGGDPIEVDNVWRDARLIVEVDGGDHRSPDIRRKDGERDRRLRAAGWTVLRVTDTDIEHEPEGAIDRVRRALRE